MPKYILILIYFFTITSISSCKYDHVEKVKIMNSISKENVYLKYYSWGFNDEMCVLSLDKSTTWPDSSKDYIINRESLFYKLQNDTLFYMEFGMFLN